MADAFVRLPTDGSGKMIDHESLTVSSNTVHRQRIQVAGAAAAELAVVTNTTPAAAAYGLVTRTPVPTAGGCSIHHRVSTADTNAVNIKASAGQIFGVHAFNNAVYEVYVKFHNSAGTPTAGNSVVFTVPVQAGARADVVLPHGLAFGTGIAMTIVKDITDAGSTAVAASDCVVEVAYK